MLRRTCIAAVALTAAVGLAACGGEDSPTTTSVSSTTTTEPTEVAEPNELRRRFEDQIRAALQQQSEDSLVDVECVIERLRETLPNDVVKEAAAGAEQGEEIPEQAVDAAFEAGQDCAAE